MASDFATTPTTLAGQGADVTYSAIISDMVRDALMAVVVTPPLFEHHDLSGEPSRSVRITKADKFTAASVAEGVELANTALTTDSVTLTTSEVGIMATITDVLELSDIPAAHGARIRQLGRAMGDKLDVDLCALLSGFSSAIGATTVNLSLANLLDAIYTLEVNDAAGTGEMVAVLHPRQTADLREDIEGNAGVIYTNAAGSPNTGANTLGKANAGYFGNWFGIDIFQSTNVPTATAGADRAGGVFIRDYALGLATKWSARVEAMRWPPIRGWVLVTSSNYGAGELEDAAGVKAVTDA